MAGAALYAKSEDVSANPFLAALAARNGEAPVEVWPENWQAFELFCQVQTQWSVAMGGPTGLRYEAVYPLISRQTQTDVEWAQLFDDLQTLEMAALEQMRDNAKD